MTISLTNSNNQENKTWKDDKSLSKRDILNRLNIIECQQDGSWCSLTDLAPRIAALREKLNIPLSKCPCDPLSTERGCIGPLCKKELIEQGICHCHCFRREWFNREEVIKLLNFYKLNIAEFDSWFKGQTGGIIDSVFYYYPWDVSRYLRRKLDNPSLRCCLPYEINQMISESTGSQDNSESPLSSPPS